jgi:hypothetical protein
MTARIKGLEGSCDQLKLTAEKVVRDKLDAELLLMDKVMSEMKWSCKPKYG